MVLGLHLHTSMHTCIILHKSLWHPWSYPIIIPYYILLSKDVNGTVSKHGLCFCNRPHLKFLKISANILNILIFYHSDLYLLGLILIYFTTISLFLLFFASFILYIKLLYWKMISTCHSFNRTGICMLLVCFLLIVYSVNVLPQQVVEPTYYFSGSILDLILTDNVKLIGDVKTLTILQIFVIAQYCFRSNNEGL